MSSARASRVLRGSVAAAFSTFVALFSHVVGGGAAPGAVGIVVPLALSVLVCIPLAGRRLTLWRIALSVAVSQFLFHTLFVLGSASRVTGSGPGSGTGHTGHGHTGAVELSVSAASGHASGHTSVSMWGAHALAAITTIAVLRHGDALLSRLADVALVVTHALAGLLAVLVPAVFVRPAAAVVTSLVHPLVQRVTLGSASRRGPPLAAAY